MSVSDVLAIVVGLALAVALDAAGMNPFDWIDGAARRLRSKRSTTA